MTPQEKSISLNHKFYKEIRLKTSDYIDENTTIKLAKECAIICCDEVIKQDLEWSMANNMKGGKYWMEVKKEIEKL